MFGWIWLILSATLLASRVDPLVASAQYYYSKNDFAQSRRIWVQVRERNPIDDDAAFKVAELTLLLEGRAPASAVLTRHWRTRETALNRERRRWFLGRWETLLSAFVTEEGQSLYLQALERRDQKEWAPALALLGRALSSEGESLPLLRLKSECEFGLGDWSAYYATLKRRYGNFPHEGGLRGALAVAHLQFGQGPRAAELFPLEGDGALEGLERLAAAYAAVETANWSRAFPLVAGFAGAKVPPDSQAERLYLQGLLARRRGSMAEARTHWGAFLALMDQREESSWDPFRLEARSKEVRLWMAPPEPPKTAAG